MIEIKNRYTGEVIRTVEAETLSDTNLSDTNLSYANLSYASLSYADLSGADLSGANLSDAYLSGANLSDAYLSGADLSRAYLRGADLSYADLRGANLSYADLSYANLSGANLSDADLREIKEDYFKRMSLQPGEVQGLYKAILDGRIDGSSYEGECACFVGTLAKLADVDHDKLINLKPDSNSPTERWYLGISKGDTPENNPISAITAEWTKEFLEREGILVPVRKLVWEETK